MLKQKILLLPVIFVGILGVVGIYEDVSILMAYGQMEVDKIYLKYLIALLGVVSYAFVQHKSRKRS